MTTILTVSPEWDVSDKVVAFTTSRQGGVSKPPFHSLNVGDHVGDNPSSVAANRALLKERSVAELEWQWLEQVHGIDVAAVSQAGPKLKADALLSRSPNLVCCVQTADCLPLFVAAYEGGEVAVIHAGWKGLASGVIENTIASMSTPVSRLRVFLGPAIGPCHFEVGEEVKQFFLATAASPMLASLMEECFVASSNQGKLMADMYAIARLKLSSVGVENISGGNLCTHCDEDSFFSYRRDGVTGRMLSAIYIEA